EYSRCTMIRTSLSVIFFLLFLQPRKEGGSTMWWTRTTGVFTERALQRPETTWSGIGSRRHFMDGGCRLRRSKRNCWRRRAFQGVSMRPVFLQPPLRSFWPESYFSFTQQERSAI